MSTWVYLNTLKVRWNTIKGCYTLCAVCQKSVTVTPKYTPNLGVLEHLGGVLEYWVLYLMCRMPLDVLKYGGQERLCYNSKRKSVHYRMIQKGKANHACILLTIACLNVLTSCLTYYKAVKQHLIGKRKKCTLQNDTKRKGKSRMYFLQ